MEDCSICLEKIIKDISKGGSKVILECSHKYHLNCIHLNITTGITPKKCPLCRSIIHSHKISFNLNKDCKEEVKKMKNILDILDKNKLFINIFGRHMNIIPFNNIFNNNSENSNDFLINLDNFSVDFW